MTKDRCRCRCTLQNQGNYCVTNVQTSFKGIYRGSGSIGIYDVFNFKIRADVEKCWEGNAPDGEHDGVFINLSGINLGPNTEPSTILPLTGISLSQVLETEDSTQGQTTFSRDISYVFSGVQVDAAVPHNQAYAVDWEVNAGSGEFQSASWYNETGDSVSIPPCSTWGRIVGIYPVPEGETSGIVDTSLPLSPGATNTNWIGVADNSIANQSGYPEQPGRLSPAQMGTGNAPDPISTSTPWDSGVDFNGGIEHLSYASASNAENAVKMGGNAVTCAAPSSAGDTSSDGQARPWATTIMFKSDGDSSNQDIWSVGQGSVSGDDNIYLRQDSSGNLLFGWGREDFGYNEASLGTINSSDWYGVYIAHNGTRLSAVDATATNLAAAFDIRVMSSSDWDDLGSNYSTSSNWSSTGNAMDRAIIGDVFVGGRGEDFNFQGKVASYINTTLLLNVAMPSDAEIEKMIIDPIAWVTGYKVGSTSRRPNSYFTFTFALDDGSSSNATQVWLMGDGVNDSFANGVRNYVMTSRVQAGMDFNGMTSNDIEAITIPRLTETE